MLVVVIVCSLAVPVADTARARPCFAGVARFTAPRVDSGLTLPRFRLMQRAPTW